MFCFDPLALMSLSPRYPLCFALLPHVLCSPLHFTAPNPILESQQSLATTPCQGLLLIQIVWQPPPVGNGTIIRGNHGWPHAFSFKGLFRLFCFLGAIPWLVRGYDYCFGFSFML